MTTTIPTDAEIRTEAREDLLFSVQFCNAKYRAGEMHTYLANVLKDCIKRKRKRVIITTPPQHGKSLLCSVEFPAWVLGRDPSWHIAATSYSQRRATRNSRECRSRLQTQEYQYLFDTRLSPIQQAVDDWGVIGGGGYKAVGIEGSLTGDPVDLLIIDDPVKDHVEASSPSRRETIWEWFLSVAYTRLSSEGIIIIIMTRWHTDDLVGRLLNPERQKEIADAGGTDSEQWHVINMPALAYEGDILGRKPGEALFPDRYSADRLRSIKAVLGSYMWAALYDGNPVRKGGNYIAVDKFVIRSPNDVPTGLRWVRYWDLATSESVKADFTAGVKVALDADGNLWIADIERGQWEWPRARGRIKLLAEAEKILVGVEAVGGFKTSFSNLREVISHEVVLHEFGVETDKLTRALPWIGLVEAGKVFLVRGEWNIPFIKEASEFPSGAHDDMVDGVSGGYTMLKGAKPIWIV